ncbi:hypothetical protein U6A24_16495 [Aquimarina gracilis]|uniref:Uncharacterized protein n=1 Tax=Aquimarina gracilis TaxID=874422 RepID=A0ABU5ZYW1_9FLAO|nr:hypothetical protein [Aquimarina gracilis]MEB3347074.1 hypothetical protein [Aquimarina gracilis]
MPLKIRFKALLTILLLSSTCTLYSQSDIDCLSIDASGLSRRAFESFEKDLFSFYKFGNDSIKTYRTFLAEVASLSLDLRKLPSNNSIQLTREFKKAATSKNSLWIKLSDYENQEAVKKSYPSTGNSKEEEIMIFNYRGGLIQCLKNTSESDDFKEIIDTLEGDGNVSTSLISQRIYYITDREFKTSQIKKFIAFDIYYSILMVIEKAFP